MGNTLSYSNYNFDDLVAALQDRLKDKDAWKDIYRSSTGQMLIELLAYVLNAGLYYTERRAQESYLSTAKNRSSVIALVSLLNYDVKRKTSASGDLTFSISSPLTKIVYIPKYTECQSADGLKYVTNEGVAIEKGQTSVSALSLQGELKQIEITANGTINQEYLISSTNVENSANATNPTLRVVVDSEEWTKVDSFINSDSISEHYRVITEMDGTVTIKFGDNVNGKAPENGSTIVLQYIESAGLSGNVTYAGKITSLNDVVYDEDGTAVTVTVTNATSFLGGDDEEDIEEIRYEAPRVFKTGDRAVSKADFIAILENYASVANVNVWGENEEAEEEGVIADYKMLNKVKMCILLQEWNLPDATFKTVFSNYIYDISMLTVKYEFVTPVILQVIPTLRITVSTGYSLSETQAAVETALASEFKLGDTTKLGTKIKYSNVISAVDNLDSVAYVTMDLEIRKVLSDTYDSAYDYGEALDATPILPESIRLFVDDTYVTTDSDNGDGTGSFSNAGGYAIDGDVNYTTGVLTLDINPAPSSNIYVRYQQNAYDNIVPTLKQICKLYEVDVTSIAMEQ
jgi:hypothetical protein